VFAFPWEGVTLVGTTDFDHSDDLNNEPRMSAAEAEYLLAAVQYAFPSQGLNLANVQASFAGVRPVVGTGRLDPSKESREHVLWKENGLLTVTGGKLTTYRHMAQAAIKSALKILGQRPAQSAAPSLNPCTVDSSEGEISIDERLSNQHRLRLIGRLGSCAQALLQAALPEEFVPINDSPALWAEMRWAARAEAVVHLDDLLLRRVRLGLILPEGGIPWLARIRQIVQPELGWDDSTWESEAKRYVNLWKQCYYLPA
jgi:glycerol-3-phosphate dehydrogenase